MTVHLTRLALAAMLTASSVVAQQQGQPAPLPPGQTTDPFPAPRLQRRPRDQGRRPRVRIRTRHRWRRRTDDESRERAGTRRLFVNDMRGPLYSVSYDGKAVSLYLDINATPWGVSVQSMGRERGFQNFAFHPQFGQPGTRGFGKFYTYTDTANQGPAADFTTPNPATTHDTVMLEWTAKTPTGRDLRRRPASRAVSSPSAVRQPQRRAHAPSIRWPRRAVPSSDGSTSVLPTAAAGRPHAPRAEPWLRIRQDPSYRSAGNEQQPTRSTASRRAIPSSRPRGALPEIYVYGVRNPQRFAWDSRNRNMFLADIGQNIVEEISLVTPGANLGWNDWEGSYRFIGRQAVSEEKPRSDPKVTYPIAEWGQIDPLLQPNSAASGLVVYRGTQIPQLSNLVIFTDMPSGEIFYVSADTLPAGGQDVIRRILLNSNGSAKTMLEVIQEKNKAQGKAPATRSDLRLSMGPTIRCFC
jgi:hypothetical protein